METLGGGRFRVGQVEGDAARAEISFPARVNLRDVPMEYAVVGEAGKLHESVLRTGCDPIDIHLAMLLLGVAPPRKGVFPSGQPIEVRLSWEAGGRERQGRMEDWIVVGEARLPMSKGPWIYNGSLRRNGVFMAGRNHSVLALYRDPEALANNPREGSDNDDIWLPRTTAIPPEGTPVRVTFRRLGPPPARSPGGTPAPADGLGDGTERQAEEAPVVP